jgi:hypothetical protein
VHHPLLLLPLQFMILSNQQVLRLPLLLQPQARNKH